MHSHSQPTNTHTHAYMHARRDMQSPTQTNTHAHTHKYLIHLVFHADSSFVNASQFTSYLHCLSSLFISTTLIILQHSVKDGKQKRNTYALPEYVSLTLFCITLHKIQTAATAQNLNTNCTRWFLGTTCD